MKITRKRVGWFLTIALSIVGAVLSALGYQKQAAVVGVVGEAAKVAIEAAPPVPTAKPLVSATPKPSATVRP